MFTLQQIRQHYELTGNHLAAVSGLKAYQGFTWTDAINTVNQWRHDKKDAIKALEESKRIAALAIRAAKNRHIWGDYATNRFIKKHAIPAKVMTLAYRMEIQKRLIKKAA